MLADKKVKVFVISKDPQAAKKFYGEVLDFKLTGEDSYGLDFEINNALLRISLTDEEHAAPANHTVLGWCVKDIYAEITHLKSKGVTFQNYPFLEQDENDVWQAPSGTKVAWFTDPNGNVLSKDQK
jgi:predicted enzyme related to lactoylglutathione lyase